MLECPPKYDFYEALLESLNERGAMDSNMSLLVQEINEEYHYWDKVKYLAKSRNVDAERLWRFIKLDRDIKKVSLWDSYNICYCPNNRMQRLCHFFDMNFGGSIESDTIIPDNKERYLINSLMEEAISSSQMEGASTTRKVAKEMLRKNIHPRSRSEQMIYNNYQTIQFVVANKNRNLTPELLSELHGYMTAKTLEKESDAGRFRTPDDDVVVEDAMTHEVVHTPPPAQDVPEFVDEVCRFFNGGEQTLFIHPIIRAVVLHFMIAYVHPFVDGNGRTARALFYWYMLRNGYWLMEYMPISRIIGKSKKMYEKAFLHSEADGNDIGYFISYNLRVLEQAFTGLQNYIYRKSREKRRAADFLHLGNINERQAELLRMYTEDDALVLTVKDLQIKFGVSPTTAKSDLTKLVETGYVDEFSFNKVKKGYVRSRNFVALTER